MSAQITEQNSGCPESVQMPEKCNVSSAKAVSNILIKEGNVGFTIEISPDQASAADDLKTAAEKL